MPSREGPLVGNPDFCSGSIETYQVYKKYIRTSYRLYKLVEIRVPSRDHSQSPSTLHEKQAVHCRRSCCAVMLRPQRAVTPQGPSNDPAPGLHRGPIGTIIGLRPQSGLYISVHTCSHMDIYIYTDGALGRGGVWMSLKPSAHGMLCRFCPWVHCGNNFRGKAP